MKKTILFCIAFCASLVFSDEEVCYTGEPGTPQGACWQHGYVCGLGFDVSNESDVMYFYLGADSSCNTLLASDSLKTYTYPGSSTYATELKLFLINDEYAASPLSLTLAGSLALSASNNKEMIFVVYKKVHDVQYGGIRLVSISKDK